MKKAILFLSIIALLLIGCDDNSTSPAENNTVKITITNAVAGSNFYYSIIEGDVTDEDIMNQNVDYVIQVYENIDATQKSFTVPSTNETGTFNCETGVVYKVAYMIDVTPFSNDLTDVEEYSTGDGGGLITFTAVAGENTVNIDYNNMQWKIGE